MQVEVIEQGRAVSVVWPDVGSAIRYESAFLHSYQKPLVESVYASAKTWNAEQFKLDPPLNFHGIESEAETRELARRLQQTGFCLIEGCPPQTESVNKVANTMGYVRDTIFGGVWQFEDNQEMADSAFMSDALRPHNDGIYSHDAP